MEIDDEKVDEEVEELDGEADDEQVEHTGGIHEVKVVALSMSSPSGSFFGGSGEFELHLGLEHLPA